MLHDRVVAPGSVVCGVVSSGVVVSGVVVSSVVVVVVGGRERVVVVLSLIHI